MVYFPLATAELRYPVAAATVFKVAVASMVIGTEYTGENVVGVVPLVV
jgi:hypothetical protein